MIAIISWNKHKNENKNMSKLLFHLQVSSYASI